MDTTIDYYNKNSKEYVNATQFLDMTPFYKEFEAYLFPKARILDLGCGSGRDCKYFLKKEYDVMAIDPSEAMCEETRKILGKNVIKAYASDIEWEDYFDGIWASASLLHIPKESIQLTLAKVLRALKNEGIMYFSVKKGNEQRFCEGRFFSDYTIDTLNVILEAINNVEVVKLWESKDLREKENLWINILIKKKGNNNAI